MNLSRGARCTVAVLVTVCLLLPRPCAPEGDQLAVGEQLSPSKPLVSDGGAFALGFFSPDGAAPRRLYLGIWYNSLPGPRTVVWVANRETPATNPTLAMANDSSTLVLSDADGRVIWTTTTTGAPSSSSSPPQPAVLGNDGNLLLRAKNNTVLWQSFDHPTDTFVPGMTIRLNHRTRQGTRIVSWKSPGDPAPGSFSYGLDPSTSLQLLMWNGTRPYWRTPVWTGTTVTSNYVSLGTNVYTAVVDGEEQMSMTSFTVSDGAVPTRYVVTASGKFQLLGWNSSASAWATLASFPYVACSTYESCGAYGYCDGTAVPVPACRCLDGFEPASASEWSAGRFGQGCRRKEPLPPCGGGGEGFLAMPSMKVPDNFVVLGGNRSAEECAATCKANCSCVAYAYANLRSLSAKGDVSLCLGWVGDVVDAMVVGAQFAPAAETLYLRVPVASSSAGSKIAVKVALPVLAGSLLLTSIFFVWFCRFRGKKKKWRKHNNASLGGMSSSDELGEGNPPHDHEFPFVRFEEISEATNNFSDTRIIGQGGFGKVYRGILGGQEVAVKRLSRDSQQGTKEFRNEVILIAKLQHRNLVQLLGCCAERYEKLLIYEYLPNKSLDASIFDESRKLLLSWATRFTIIKGIARGLLYLHQDSRMTIIHRDLKAGNVLLDAEMKPKIADFGMARIFGDNQQDANTQRVVGTYGYMAPEYAMEGVFSTKSDVYSFGVLLLEVITGIRRNSNSQTMGFPSLTVYSWNMWKEGRTEELPDSSILDTCSADEVLLCVHVALLCVQENPDDKPLMSSIVFVLENGSTTLPSPSRPAYFARRSVEKMHILDDIQASLNSFTLTEIEGR